MNKDLFKTARPFARLRQGRTDWYRVENKTATGADVYIYDEIGYLGVTAQDFIKDFNAIKAPAITLHLDTPGGDVFDGINIFNAIQDHPAEVTVVVDSLAASAGSFIAQAGDKRVMNRNSTMMIHDAHGMTIGNSQDHQRMIELLDKMSNNIASIYAQKAGGTTEQWRTTMQAETWYTAEEAVEAGLADEVIVSSEKWNAGNSFDLSIFSYAGRDQAPPPVITPVVSEPEDPYQGIDWAQFANALKGAIQ